MVSKTKNPNVIIFHLTASLFCICVFCLQPLWLLPFSFRGNGDSARGGKRNSRPGIYDSRSGNEQKSIYKNVLYQNGRSSDPSTSWENSCGTAFRGAAVPESVGCSRLANTFILPMRSLFLTS